MKINLPACLRVSTVGNDNILSLQKSLLEGQALVVRALAAHQLLVEHAGLLDHARGVAAAQVDPFGKNKFWGETRISHRRFQGLVHQTLSPQAVPGTLWANSQPSPTRVYALSMHWSSRPNLLMGLPSVAVQVEFLNVTLKRNLVFTS
jgi:hypothetical protein